MSNHFTVVLLSVNLDVYQLTNLYSFTLNANKGCKNLSTDKVANLYLFQGAEDANISIVLGPTINGHCHLVVACFHNPKTIPSDKVTVD